MKLYTADNCLVYVAMEHLKQHESVLPYLQEALSKVWTHADAHIKVTLDMGRVVGKSDLVATTENDEIVYAVRTGRGWPTRFAKNRESHDSQFITVIMRRSGMDRYRLVTAFIGKGAEREPGDPTLRTEHDLRVSEQFWANHALVWGSQEVKDAA